jgi:hypothetical protein
MTGPHVRVGYWSKCDFACDDLQIDGRIGISGIPVPLGSDVDIKASSAWLPLTLSDI